MLVKSHNNLFISILKGYINIKGEKRLTVSNFDFCLCRRTSFGELGSHSDVTVSTLDIVGENEIKFQNNELNSH